jgi:hypothetical protein
MCPLLTALRPGSKGKKRLIVAFLGDKLELEFNNDLEPGFWCSLDGSPFFYFTLTRVLMAIAIITA